MVKLTILFHQPSNEEVFESNYNTNLALLEKMPGIRKRQACTVWGSPGGKSAYYRILEFYFDGRDALDAAMVSQEGRAAGADLMRFARDAELVFADVFEDNN